MTTQSHDEGEPPRAPSHKRPLPTFVPAPRLVELVPAYRAHLLGEKRRPKGMQGYLKGLLRFVAWLGADATMADVTNAAVERYQEAMGARNLANETIRKALCIIRDFSRWAITMGLRSDDPTTGVKRPRRKRPDPNPLYSDEIAILFRAIAVPDDLTPYERRHWERNRLAVLIYLYTGMRLSELQALRWEHIKLSAALIEIRDGKGGKDRTVPMHPTLLLELLAVPEAQREPHMAVFPRLKPTYDPDVPKDTPVNGKTNRIPEGMPVSEKTMGHICGRWLRARLRAELGEEAFRIYAHRLRHTFASHLVWSDTDLRTLQELLGHTQLSTTEHYVKVDHKRKRAAIARLDFDHDRRQEGA